MGGTTKNGPARGLKFTQFSYEVSVRTTRNKEQIPRKRKSKRQKEDEANNMEITNSRKKNTH